MRFKPRWTRARRDSSDGVAQRIGVGVDLFERVAEQDLRSRPPARDPVRPGRHPEQIDVIDPGRARILADARPKLERALDQLGHLAIGVHPAGRLRGVDACAQRRGLIAGRRIVAGDHRRAFELAVAGRVLVLECEREREVPLAALARQQVVVQRLAQERVTEAEALVLVGDQNLLGERLAQRRLGRVAIAAGDGRDRLLGQRAPDRDRARRTLSPRRRAARSAP